jgi:DNA polymerase beta
MLVKIIMKTLNDNIISELNKLAKQIEYEIDHAPKSDRVKNMFRLLSVRKTIKIIEKYPKTIKSADELKDIEGIGKGTLSRLDEILKTGKLSEIKDDIINNKYLKYVEELEEIFGIGRRRAFELFDKYNVRSIEDLKKLHASGEVDLPDNIIKGLKYYGIVKEKIPRSEMDQMNNFLQNTLLSIDPQLFGVVCGSYRRLKPFSNDIDMMIVHPNIKTKADFLKTNYLEIFIKELKKNKFIVDSLTGDDVTTKFMGYCQLDKNHSVRRLDIRYMPYESFYSGLLYFTGSGNFNKKMRLIAIDSEYILNEYGLFTDKGKMFKVNSEKQIFDLLNMEYLTPDLRD